MAELTEERLQEIEARANAAQPGPWKFGVGPDLCWAGIEVQGDNPRKIVHAGHAYPADLKFIAAAREDVPALIAELRRLQGAYDRMTDWAQQMENERDEARAEVRRLWRLMHPNEV